jgi:type IV pilus assembly protein PilO
MEVSPQLQARLDQIAKLPQSARAAIIFGIAALVVVGYYFGIYAAKAEQLEGLRSNELELQRKLSEVRSVAANLAAFEEEIANLELKLGKVLRQLPNEKELEILLTDISNLGKKSGIEIKAFKRLEEVPHDFYAEVPIAIEIEGGYHNIARFFDMMSDLPRIVNMGSMVLKVSMESMDETRLKVTGTLTTFRFVGDDVDKKKA